MGREGHERRDQGEGTRLSYSCIIVLPFIAWLLSVLDGLRHYSMVSSLRMEAVPRNYSGGHHVAGTQFSGFDVPDVVDPCPDDGGGGGLACLPGKGMVTPTPAQL